MAYTNRLSVMLRDKTYRLDEMGYDELCDLRSRLRFDVSDIDNQVEKHDADIKSGHGRRPLWRNKSVSAAKIKIHDIGKINDVIESLDVAEAVTDKHMDLSNVDIHKVLTDAMRGVVTEERMMLVLDRVYAELNRGSQ